MDFERQVKSWLVQDVKRLHLLQTAAKLQLDDWCFAAGFLRNMVWDKLHDVKSDSALNDIYLIYFNNLDVKKNNR
ncbi:MAG: nucleotidyltransferase family protein [Oceanospirillaceae bacterium]